MQDEGLDPFAQHHMYHQGTVVLSCRLGYTHDTGKCIVRCILSYLYNYVSLEIDCSVYSLRTLLSCVISGKFRRTRGRTIEKST